MRPSEDLLARLRTAWEDLLRPFGTSANLGSSQFNYLVARYTAPERHYHNLVHISEMLEIVEALAHDARDGNAVRLAVWFHDAIYDSGATDNEERSAEFAWVSLPTLGVSAETTDTAVRLILLTKTHRTGADDRDAQILMDADLAILGAEESRYDEYAAAIRREYAWVSPEEYRIGRSKSLQTFLTRPRIYFTDTLFDLREERARKNLAKEIERLSNASIPI